ncbi:hypothetical protein D8674_024530 [Pyrus ussuriensis x Pyrus communis]|uniref:Uncharacterized protein n=1 Tax=Pyrus ussuriensis x Pyrus communis TaxID=2448454 RepID=A0A5N5H452_9ROSA|nr:hypothetical protein D8674_024530 [Pyrus ussuriensis x Pyrus communis]
MSNKEAEEERRLSQSSLILGLISVFRFDERIQMMDTRSRLSKRRKEDNEVFVRTITRFLHDLRTNPAEPDGSTTPGDRN